MRNSVKIIVCLLVIFVLAGMLTAQNDTSNFNYNTPKSNSDLHFYHPPKDNFPYRNIDDNEPLNVIVMIGDGQGLGQTTLARMKACGPDGTLYVEKFPVTGIVRTHSGNALVTDSAASATALACGIKTTNGLLGMDADGQKYMNIMELAKKKGMATGVVVTCTVNHATPAGFNAHVRSRNMYPEIAVQQARCGMDVMMGGGKSYFIPQSQQGSKRKDDLDLMAEMKNSGYAVVQTRKDMAAADSDKLVGLFADDALTTLPSPTEPTLAEMTLKAIKILQKNKSGFVLMVEGSQIDWACHANDFSATLKQTLLFDQAVKVAAEFAIRNRNTLVIVTADHETGGLTIPSGPLDCRKLSAENVNWSTKGHSAVPVVLYAFGPGSLQFTGVYDNTDVPKKIAELLKMPELPAGLSDDQK